MSYRSQLRHYGCCLYYRRRRTLVDQLLVVRFPFMCERILEATEKQRYLYIEKDEQAKKRRRLTEFRTPHSKRRPEVFGCLFGSARRACVLVFGWRNYSVTSRLCRHTRRRSVVPPVQLLCCWLVLNKDVTTIYAVYWPLFFYRWDRIGRRQGPFIIAEAALYLSSSYSCKSE